MAGIRVPTVHQVPPGARRDLLLAVHRLYELAGKPPIRMISELIRGRDDLPGTLSHEGVSAVLKGVGRSHRWPNIESLVRLLAERAVSPLNVDDEVVIVHRLWIAADGDPDGELPALIQLMATTGIKVLEVDQPVPSQHHPLSDDNAGAGLARRDVEYVQDLRSQTEIIPDEPLVRWNPRLRTLDVYDRQMAIQVIENVGHLDG